jgi:uncharacterized protein (DUF427 family)
VKILAARVSRKGFVDRWYTGRMKALWENKIIAEAPREDLAYIEGKWYFPPSSVNKQFLHKSNTETTCPWRGTCKYFHVGRAGDLSKDGAWTYPTPDKKAIHKVKKDFSNYVAFWGDIKVGE